MTKPGYIMTNIPEGFVKVSYYAIFTDEEAMPMIPDIESYKVMDNALQHSAFSGGNIRVEKKLWQTDSN